MAEGQIEVELENGSKLVGTPIVCTDPKIVEAGNEICINIPAELEGRNLAVVLVEVQ